VRIRDRPRDDARTRTTGAPFRRNGPDAEEASVVAEAAEANGLVIEMAILDVTDSEPASGSSSGTSPPWS